MELAASQTGEGEMVVESQHSLRVVEGLDIVTRRGVAGAPVDVLHHVKVGRNVWDVTSLLPLQKIIEEVNIPEGPGDYIAGLSWDFFSSEWVQRSDMSQNIHIATIL